MKPQIKVFISKSREFRVRIKEGKESIPYEVTVGGESWKKGKGRSYEKQIKRKCELLVLAMSDKLNLFNYD